MATIPPWLQPLNPVPAYLQAIAQGAALAGEQNQADRAAQAEEQRARQFAEEMALNRQRETRLAQQGALEMQATQLGLQQRAAQQARELAAQQKIQEGIQAGLSPSEAIRRSAYLLPVNVMGQIAQQDASLARQEKINQMLIDRARLSNALRLQAKTGVATEADGQISPEAVQAAAEKSAKMNQPAAVRKSEEFVTQLKKVRPELTEAQIDEAKARYLASGAKGLNPDATERKAISADDEAARGIGDTLSKVEQFNAKFGPNAFDRFTGPIEGRIQQFRNNYSSFKKEDERLAREIASDVAFQIQAYRKQNFGTALTKPEIGTFRKIVDDQDSAAYLTTLQAFRNSLSDSISRRLENYPATTEIPQPIIERYSGRNRATLGGQPAANATAGKIKSIKQVR